MVRIRTPNGIVFRKPSLRVVSGYRIHILSRDGPSSSAPQVVDPLVIYISPAMAVAYSGFIAFTQFSMLNVITGIFVDSALRNSREEALGPCRPPSELVLLVGFFGFASRPKSGRIRPMSPKCASDIASTWPQFD